MLRYSKLNDEQLLKRLMEITKAEQVSFTSEGLEAIIFTAQGDMRQVDYLLFLLFKRISLNLGY
jgi:replication factor C subunit 2/4